MIHIDTHIAIWLFQGRVDAFPPAVQALLGAATPLLSPMARLELQFLHELGRINPWPADIVAGLEVSAGLRVAESSFLRVAAIAATLTWTRDPFDRMIAAHALADDLPLVTKDATLLAHCAVARWS